MRRRKVLLVVALSIVFLMSFALTASAASAPPVPGEYYGAGYWANHPESWPLETITYWNGTYTKEQAIELMKTPVRGDMSYAAFRQWVGYILNRANGGAPLPLSAHQSVFMWNWFASYKPGCGLSSTDPVWISEGARWTSLCEYYNTNGPPPPPY